MITNHYLAHDPAPPPLGGATEVFRTGEAGLASAATRERARVTRAVGMMVLVVNHGESW